MQVQREQQAAKHRAKIGESGCNDDEFDEQSCFRLLGRLDRIVKVEGKRISPAAIERLLGDDDWVEDVRALTLERARVETAIVMQLSTEGAAQLQRCWSRRVL